MPQPTDDGKTYTFKIRSGVKFHDGSPLTAADVAASWEHIVHPPEGVLSPRESHYLMVDTVEAPDPTTVVFRLKFATSAFLPALSDPFAFIYQKKVLDKDPHWYEKNILGSGPFKFADYEVGQSISGVRNPDYYHQGQPYLDGFVAIYAPKQATRIDALRAARTCYDHLAGRLGTALMDALLKRGFVTDEHVTDAGIERLGELGIDLDAIPGRRPRFRSCLDWSERRPHAAGKLGAALAAHVFELGWVERLDGSRALRVTAAGEAGFIEAFGLPMVQNGHVLC
jgi:ABC-type transport system substrate-binding protein